VFYSGMIFNNVPQNFKNLSSDASKFKYTVKKVLHVGSFYSLGEYCNWRTKEDLGSYKLLTLILIFTCYIQDFCCKFCRLCTTDVPGLYY
jgi:hypothetical protein